MGVVVKDPFAQLELLATAGPAEVKTRWRELCRIHHPDRGGNAVTFHELRQAYQQAMALAQAPKPCQPCNGTGKQAVARGFASLQLSCPACGGTGVLS